MFFLFFWEHVHHFRMKVFRIIKKYRAFQQMSVGTYKYVSIESVCCKYSGRGRFSSSNFVLYRWRSYNILYDVVAHCR